jgi:hypothetical protein
MLENLTMFADPAKAETEERARSPTSNFFIFTSFCFVKLVIKKLIVNLIFMNYSLSDTLNTFHKNKTKIF